MNLGEIRAKFIELSGRDDLVKSDDSDDGANFFINAGQRYLDRTIDFKKSDGVYFEEFAADTWYMKIQTARTIDHIWINNSEERWELERVEFDWLQVEFASLISETDTGSPVYWSPAKLRGIDVTDIAAQGTFFNYVEAEAGNEEYSGLLILPPPDTSIVLEVIGKFYSPELSSDSDESYWSVAVPETLIKAALMSLEGFYRNTEGLKDYSNFTDIDVVGIDKDLVHEDNANVDCMEG